MSGNGEQVPVDRRPRSVTVGTRTTATLQVRRLRRHDLVNCAAKVRLGHDEGTTARYMALIARMALACGPNRGRVFDDPETGESVTVSIVEVDEVGLMVSADVYNALTSEQLNQVLQAAQGEALTEAQAGNSEGPPRGSTDNASGNAAN